MYNVAAKMVNALKRTLIITLYSKFRRIDEKRRKLRPKSKKSAITPFENELGNEFKITPKAKPTDEVVPAPSVPPPVIECDLQSTSNQSVSVTVTVLQLVLVVMTHQTLPVRYFQSGK